jgi:hypothetical protein
VDDLDPNGLPPGPWRIVEVDGYTVGLVDAEDEWVVHLHEIEYERPAIDFSPEVGRAIKSLPSLVEAARGLVDAFSRDRSLIHCDSVKAFHGLVAVLSRIARIPEEA